MYKVMTTEWWNGHKTEAVYTFDDELEMLSFMIMCRDDKVQCKLLRDNCKSKIAV